MMKKTIIVVITLLLPFLGAGCGKTEDAQVMNHEKGPQNAQELPPEFLRKMEEIKNSPYYKHVHSLEESVVGREILKTQAGTSGFVLYLDNQKWVMACLDEGAFRWRMGTGALGESEKAMLNSPLFGDASKPLGGNVPYADQTCDFSAEVAKAKGKQITGLSYGERSFNFCFPEKRELDVNLRQDAEGKLAYRVYWEQW